MCGITIFLVLICERPRGKIFKLQEMEGAMFEVTTKDRVVFFFREPCAYSIFLFFDSKPYTCTTPSQNIVFLVIYFSS